MVLLAESPLCRSIASFLGTEYGDFLLTLVLVIVALQAGCSQQPATGMVIGLNDTVFTTTQVAITTASAASSTTNGSGGSHSLSTGAKIGIIVAAIIILLIITGVSIIWYKKRQRKTIVESRYDPRFGAPEISAPTAGAFVNPICQTSPTSKTFVKYNPREFHEPKTTSSEELRPNSPASTDLSSKSGSQPSSPPYTGSTLPVHQAYIQNPRQALRGPLSPETPSPPNSAPIRARTYSSTNSAAGATPPNSAPIRTRNFSTPTSIAGQSSQESSSAKSNPTGVTPYDPSTSVPRFESGLVQQQQQQQQRQQRQAPRPNVPAPLRPTPGRSQAWNTESSHSVELWPGTM
jgi:hypothetical protein